MYHPKTLRDHCLAILCKTRPVTFSSKLTLPLQPIPDVIERLIARRDEGGLPYTIVSQLVEHLSDKGILSVQMLELLLRQSRGSLSFLHLSLTQLTFDDFLRLPPIAYLVDFDCTNVDHVSDALWEKLTPSRTSLRSFAAIGLDNPAFHFERIAEFSNISSLNLSYTCVSVDDVIVICRTLAESLTMLDVSECSQLDLLAVLPGIRLARNLTHLSLHDLPVAKDLIDYDKESVLSTFKDAFNCLSSLKFLDVGWIKDAGIVTRWDVARVILKCRGSGLTHLDVSGLTTLRETLRFVKELGIERSLQYLGALHTNLDYRDVDPDDDPDSVTLDYDLEEEVDDLKIVATGFKNVDEFFPFQPQYISPTPRNHEILKLIAGRLLIEEMMSNHWGPTDEEADILSSFALGKCRGARRSKGGKSHSYPLLSDFACFTSYLCLAKGFNRENALALLNELIVRALSISPSAKFATSVLEHAKLTLDHGDSDLAVDAEQYQLLLVIAFCHFKCSNTDSVEQFSSYTGSFLYYLSYHRNARRNIAISRGFALALVDVLESSLSSSQSRFLSEEIVQFLRVWYSAMEDAEISILLARRIGQFSDVLCSLYDTLDENNVWKAEPLLDTFYGLSIQKPNRSLLEKPAVFSLIWRSLNFSHSSRPIERFAAELFASLTFESSTPFFGTATNFVDGLSAEKFWQRISENCEKVPPPTAYKVHTYSSTRHYQYYYFDPMLTEYTFRQKHILEMILSCLEKDCRTLQSPILVYTLSTLTSCVLLAKVTESKEVQSRIAKILRSLENDDAGKRNEFVQKLIEKMKPFVGGWNV